MEKMSKKRRNVVEVDSNGHSASRPKMVRTDSSSTISSQSSQVEVQRGPVVLNWDKLDMTTLLSRIEGQLPKSDHVKFTTAVERFNWDNVAFKSYTPQDCKHKWLEIQARLRRFRTLTDLVNDAKEWIKTPWTTHTAYKQTKHPDQPKKPLTPYFRYYHEQLSKITDKSVSVTDLAKLLAINYKSLSEKKKKKYKDMYQKDFEEYKKQMEQFRSNHPELESASASAVTRSNGRPSKPKTPMQLFMDVKGAEPIQGMDRKEQMDKLKDDWNKLKETKRIKWIRRALEDEARYVQELDVYKEKNTSFEVPTIRGVLNKAEKCLKDKFDGKPVKPVRNGYSLFYQLMMAQLKADGQGIDGDNQQMMVGIAKKWKELSQDEKDVYNNKARVLIENYVQKLDVYVQKLDENERKKVLLENRKFRASITKTSKRNRNTNNQDDHQSSDDNESDDDQRVDQVAFQLFQRKRINKLQADGVPITEVIDTIFKEWSALKMSKKRKYLKKAAASIQTLTSSEASATSGTYQESASMVKTEKKSKTGTNGVSTASEEEAEARRRQIKARLIMRAPDAPPKSGYALFTQQSMPKLMDMDPEQRMAKIAKVWTCLPKDQQKKMNDKVKEKMELMTKFKETLNDEELLIFNDYLDNENLQRLEQMEVDSVDHQLDPVVDGDDVGRDVEIITSQDSCSDGGGSDYHASDGDDDDVSDDDDDVSDDDDDGSD